MCRFANDVAELQGETCGNRRHQRRDAEDQVARIGILAKLAVHPAFDVEILGIEIIAGRDPWAHRTECIERFAQKPLLVIALAIAGGDVVDDRISENVVVGLLRLDIAAFLADDERKLGQRAPG